MFLKEFVIVGVVEHPISDAVLVDKVGYFLLAHYELNDVFELGLDFGLGRVNVDQQVLVFEVAAG